MFVTNSELTRATLRLSRWGSLAVLLALSTQVFAGPFIPAGDVVLRHDIQRLADYGLISGPVTTWPLMWGPIAADLRSAIWNAERPADVQQSLRRVLDRADWEMRVGELTFSAEASVAETPTRIRSFANTPRESAEISGGLSYTGDRFLLSLSGQAVDSPDDGRDFRMDGAVVGMLIGNFSVTVNTLERWWGPGWDGSLVLSNNARPMPSLSIDRNDTSAFDSKWLSWLGDWDFSMHFAELERDRHISNAQFFGLRFNFRPIPSLEIGLSRTAQWCGDGRPCDAETFFDLLLGRDNRGQGSINAANEPGNQLAGLDFRWSLPVSRVPIAMYGQFIGEDEAGGLPSRYIGQLGGETTGLWRQRWSYRWFAEFTATNCQFLQSAEHFNCAYNHGVYQTGYRYRGRVVGHGADNDSRIASTGLILANDADDQWIALLRFGELNRFGAPDSANTLTSTRQDIWSIDVTHNRAFRFGTLSFGIGIEMADDIASGQTSDDVRGFFQWRSAY